MKETKDKCNKLINELTQQRDALNKRIDSGLQIIRNLEQQERDQLKKEAKNRIDPEIYNQWLLKLLQNMEFEGIWYGDIVSIGVCGKRPFGNSYMNSDIVDILGWKYEGEEWEKELSKNQEYLIEIMLDDLPDFLNNFLRK